jgi:hypothetical protein
MYHPPLGGEGYVELRNTTDTNVPLFDLAHPTNTWKLAGLGYTLPTGLSLGPGHQLAPSCSGGNTASPEACLLRVPIPAACRMTARPSGFNGPTARTAMECLTLQSMPCATAITRLGRLTLTGPAWHCTARVTSGMAMIPPTGPRPHPPLGRTIFPRWCQPSPRNRRI